MAKNNYSTLEGIQQHPAYLDLTTNQQKWVLIYLETGDRITATHTAYPSTAKPTTTKHDYAEERATANMRVPNIRAVIAAFTGVEPPPLPLKRHELSALISEQLRSPDIKPSEFTKLTTYLMILNDWRGKRTTTDLVVGTGMKMAKRKLKYDLTGAAEEVDDSVQTDLLQQWEAALKKGQ